MSGSEPLTCVNERTEALKRLCIKEMPDRAYHAYLEFFSDAQNMCYFLQHQMWHKQTEKTIDSLSRNSQEVSDKLKEASEVQSTLLNYQEQGLFVQQQLLERSANLSESLVASKQVIRKLVEDVTHSTNAHKGVLDELFKEFHLLHSWLVGRYSLLDKVLYYGISIVLIMVATSFSFTGPSRVYLILNLCINYLAELILPAITISTITLDSYAWTIRKLFIFSSILIFIYFIFKYEDKFERQMRMLAHIESQNRQIIDDILFIKLNKVGRERIRSYTQAPAQDSYSITEKLREYSSTPQKDSQSYRENTPPSTSCTNNEDINLMHNRMPDTPKLPILVEIDDDDADGNETVTPEKLTRSVSRASTVSQSSSRYNLRRRTEIFNFKD